MRSFRIIAALVVYGLTFISSLNAATILTPVDISEHYNLRIQTLLGAAPNFPDGPISGDGIPFSRPASGLNAWTGWYELAGSMEGLRTIDIDVGIFGATEVYTLINTLGGEQLAGTYATLEFYGSGGGFFQRSLDGNSDVRDYLFGEYTNSINGTTTVNVFTTGSGQYDEVRLDMQKIALPIEFASQRLDTIRVLDAGGTIDGVLKQRLMISGITVSGFPEPVPGDTDGDGDVDTADLTTSLQNFTGDGGSGKTIAQGDTDYDGDVDTADLTRAFQNFTGAIEADLLYDPATGNVKLDAAESPGDIINQFALTNAVGGQDFNTGVANFPFGLPLQTDLPTEISNIDTTSTGFSGIWDLGNIFPTGLNETTLASFLTSATYGGTPGTGSSRPFDLVVVGGAAAAVPEPSSFLLAVLGCVGVGLCLSNHSLKAD